MITPLVEPLSPSDHDVNLAEELRASLDKGNPSLNIIFSQNGEERIVSLTEEEYPALSEVLSQIAKGKSVIVLPLDEELSTQQAADLLNVSRPFLIKLLENHEIPFRTVGSWRRVRLADLLAYKRKDDAQRDSALQELADQAQDLNLGY